MYLTILLYYFIYIFFIFGIIPIDSLFYLRPLFIVILSIIFLIPTKLIKKKFLPIFIFFINFIAIFILGEFSNVSIKTTIILVILTTIILILILVKRILFKIIGFILLSILLILGFWNGEKLNYVSNLPRTINNTEEYNSFTYGTNRDIPTYSVDSSSYYKGNTGLAAWYDRVYWKISTDLPLNGRVFYPKKTGIYPLIVIVHGNHLAEDSSQFGYDYLLKNFAKNGYIAVSIDENFLNGNWTTLGVGLPKENDARAYIILEHLKLFQNWNSTISSKLFNMIDMNNIGLIGHSRGGEAISIAQSKDGEFSIKGLMALSPTDRQFRENIYCEDISYITLHGANDGDLIQFKGRGQYNRTFFTSDKFNFKASYYIEGLNHTQFNSDWGEIDSTGLGKFFYGKNQNVNAIDQREIAKELGLTFFNIVLKNREDELSKIKNPREIKTIPSVQFITEYSDSSSEILYDFQQPESSENIKTSNMTSNYVNRRYNKALQLDGIKSSFISFKNKFPDIKMDKINFSLASNLYEDQTLVLKLILQDKIVSTYTITLKKALIKNTFKTKIFKFKQDEIESHFQFFEISSDNWDRLIIETKSDKSSYLIDNISYPTK